MGKLMMVFIGLKGNSGYKKVACFFCGNKLGIIKNDSKSSFIVTSVCFLVLFYCYLSGFTTVKLPVISIN